MKPDCYNCIHRTNIPGDAHSACKHPEAPSDLIENLMSMLSTHSHLIASDKAGMERLNIRGNEHGIKNGWFNWPFNFDPVWLESCNGFEPKDKPWYDGGECDGKKET